MMKGGRRRNVKSWVQLIKKKKRAAWLADERRAFMESSTADHQASRGFFADEPNLAESF